MLHLAQVQGKDAEGKVTVQLLARQKSEHLWSLLKEPESVCVPDDESLNQGMMVLLELNGDRIEQIKDAKDWLLELVHQFLTSGVTPALLEEEAQRAEQWRQSLTLQNQELGRRMLEMEARRDQIQELEEKLRHEKKQLEAMAAELQTRSNSTSL